MLTLFDHIRLLGTFFLTGVIFGFLATAGLMQAGKKMRH